VRYIEAIEADQFELLPGAAFVIGFLKNYAQCIGLDEDEVVTRYLDFENEKTGEESPKKIKTEDLPKTKKSMVGPFFIIMIFALAAFLIYYFFNLTQ
jgi:cytoskeletal protein RodZ